ncbi:hypothetical protein [Haliangium ochraceum]|uniref:hypothetical protein n=1 Tax=Haliangium ochraceum TaxID=80816 RepID=UPI0018F04A46|nr:hypothetical protein [Haliangium ochraceum]
MTKRVEVELGAEAFGQDDVLVGRLSAAPLEDTEFDTSQWFAVVIGNIADIERKTFKFTKTCAQR